MRLLRSGAKGNFVLYPKEWPKRWLEPRGRRFQTACDMLVGGCACGRHHSVSDDATQEYLAMHGATIESMQSWRERTRKTRISKMGV